MRAAVTFCALGLPNPDAPKAPSSAVADTATEEPDPFADASRIVGPRVSLYAIRAAPAV